MRRIVRVAKRSYVKEVKERKEMEEQKKAGKETLVHEKLHVLISKFYHLKDQDSDSLLTVGW